MFTDPNPIRELLANGLLLKSISTDEEVERLAAFNATVHEEEFLSVITRAMIRHHPHTRPDEWLVVVDPERADLIVSSLCQIPWRWRYGAVELKAHEMGIVGTLPDYRKRGLVRALDRQFKRLLAASGAHVSQIQGIPYYYRQFGYEYALPLEGGWELELRRIPDEQPEFARGYHFRQATTADIPLLETYYADMVRDLDIYAARDAATWRYLLEHIDATADGGATWIVAAPGGTPQGYLRIAARGFGDGLIVHEASPLRYPAALAALGWLKQLAITRSKPYLRLAMADSNPLITFARTHDARDTGRYAWQLHIPDAAHLLRAIAPELERRIADSPFAGLTHTLTLNMFRSAVALQFEDGAITGIDTTAAAANNAENHLPPNLLAPLVFGWRSCDELEATYPDFAAWGLARPLFDVLFPKQDAFFYTIY